MIEFFAVLWLYIPAFAANATPVLVAKIPLLVKWNTPISEKSLGKNKTWRGLICGIFGSIIISITVAPFEIFTKNLLWGALIGFGALAGDAIESWVKRKINIAPGKPLPFFDGVDYMIGAIALGLFLYTPNIWHAICICLLGVVLSLIANTISYFLGIKNVWY